MAATPVEILGLKYPLCKELIHKLSNKWQQRTKKNMTKWPKEGTFDVSLCEEMETLIKNHKTKGNSKKREKREAKREKEKEVLALFKKEGEDSLKSIKQARKILKEADKETKKKEELFSKPPPCLPPEGQFPILKGTVEVSGENQYKEDREEEASLILVLQECAGDVDNLDITKMTVPPIHGNSHLGVEGGELAAAHPGSITWPSKPLGRSKSRILGVPRESYRGESASNFNN